MHLIEWFFLLFIIDFGTCSPPYFPTWSLHKFFIKVIIILMIEACETHE